jgi:hypothetical protein
MGKSKGGKAVKSNFDGNGCHGFNVSVARKSTEVILTSPGGRFTALGAPEARELALDLLQAAVFAEANEND